MGERRGSRRRGRRGPRSVTSGTPVWYISTILATGSQRARTGMVVSELSTAERAAYSTQAGNGRGRSAWRLPIRGGAQPDRAQCGEGRHDRGRELCCHRRSLPCSRLSAGGFLLGLTTARPACTNNSSPLCRPPRTRYPPSPSSRSTPPQTRLRVRPHCGTSV